MTRNELVSAVIPTRNRPDLVLRAVTSALGQTYAALEVVVVVDGPDPATVAALSQIKDERLRLIELPESGGAQKARNTGIAAARGRWIALLDDDDEWLPEKTAKQMERALSSAYKYPIVSCRFLSRAAEYDLVWPRKEPREPLSEYLLARDSLSMGEGMLSTITLLFPKELYEFQPFTPELKRCQEVDWVLRSRELEGVGVEFIPEALAVAYQHEERPRITTVPDWRTSLEWVETVNHLITRRAYASYLSITVASQAARQNDWRAVFPLIKRIVTKGSPKPRDLAFFFSVWCVPRKLQLAVRRAGL